jgi:hypothetical protein
LRFKILQFLDTWGHRLRVPKFALRPVCDRYDAMLLASSLLGEWPEESDFLIVEPTHPMTFRFEKR